MMIFFKHLILTDYLFLNVLSAHLVLNVKVIKMDLIKLIIPFCKTMN